MKINNIVCKGTFKQSGKNQSENKIKIKTSFLENTLIIYKNSFCLYLTREIRHFFLGKKLKKTIKKVLQREIKSEVKSIHITISNIHYSTNIEITGEDLISQLLPLIDKNFTIDNIQVSQEPLINSQTSIQNLIEEKKSPFMGITIKLFKGKTTLRFQLNKRKTHAHTTLIATNLDKNCMKLLNFLAEYKQPKKK